MDLTVLHVLEALEGGTARHLVDLVHLTPGVTHHVVVPPRRLHGVTDERAPVLLQQAGAVVHSVPMSRRPVTAMNLAAVRAIRGLVTRIDPAVVHAHSSIGGLLARTAVGRRGPPCVYTPNGVTQLRTGLRIERYLGGRTSRVVAVSESEAALLVEHRIVDQSRVVIIPNGVDPAPPPAPQVELRSLLGLDPKVPLVGTVARLVAQKDPLTFVRAVAHDPSGAHWVLIGDGPLRSRVEREVRRLGLGGRVHLVEVLPDAASYFPELAVFVLASRYEGGPYSPLEAMRAGRAVVLTDVVGNRDVIVDGTSGVLVPAGDPVALAGAVGRLLADDDLRRSLGSRGRQRVEECFDVAEAADRLTALYQEVIGGK